MKVRAHVRNARMAPRKVRALREVVLGLPAADALAQLAWQQGKAATVMHKVLRSAVANAQHNHEIEETNLRVAAVEVNEGLVFKRFQAVSRGSGHPFVKRNSHVTVVLEEIEPSKKETTKKTEIDTLSVEELAKQSEQVEEKVEEHDDEPESAADESEQRGKQLESYTKTKMQQRGGDKKKTHRRKSI